jgi:hypothetical protein
MMLTSSRSIFLAIGLLIFLVVNRHEGFAQRNCGTVKYLEDSYGSKLPGRQEKFEEWIKTKKAQIAATSAFRKQSEPYKIPVVIHVIHNGESVGNGANISEAQVLSQIKVLNNDFRRTNADAVNTPAEFASVAASMDIEFVLAKRNPDGIATTGIVRVDGNRGSWSMNDNYNLKSLSYWPSEDYLNIWVCNITDYLGYAQFPVSDLQGLEEYQNGNALTDGVVIAHTCFGSKDDGNFDLEPFYDKGRTTTHEVSHFFGLKHIWGDDGSSCSGTDHVDDTPNQADYTSGCPSHPTTSCGGTVTMFQNFLDYTDDECMNLFTSGQMDRMSVVIENSPRRKTLLTSVGLNEPDPVPNDLGIRKIVSPSESECGLIVTPSIELLNYGTNDITSASIRLKLNGITKETKSFTLDLAPEEITTVQFSQQTLVGGSNDILFEILLTNGVADGDAVSNKNIYQQEVFVPESINVPFSEKFNDDPAGWRIVNNDDQITWEVLAAPRETLGNKALGLNFYHYELEGEQDVLYTPVFSLEDSDTAYFFLDRANAQFEDRQDVFKIYVIESCESLSSGDLVFNKSGEALATAGKVATSFQPQETRDWQRNFVDLSDYVGKSEIQLAFVGVNNYGNNLYIDNITVANSPNKDIAIKEVINPRGIACETTIPLTVKIENTGASSVTSLDAAVTINGSLVHTQSFGNLVFDGDKEATLTISDVTLESGTNKLSVAIATEETGISDEADNNVFTRTVMNHEEEDVIPLRLTFEDDVHDTWANFNIHSESGKKWKTSEVFDGETALSFEGFSNALIGDEAWFVSPILDFRRAKEASLVFDMSYKQRGLIQDVLTVGVSTDCGETFEPVEFVWPEFEQTESKWTPQSSADWFQLEGDLSNYAGKENIRVIFKIVNSNGNNLFLDNIEFFLTDKPFATAAVEDDYDIRYQSTSPSTPTVHFNLDERTDVPCKVIDMKGQIVSEVLWLDVLNQAYEFPVAGHGAGIYIVDLRINGRIYRERIFVGDK